MPFLGLSKNELLFKLAWLLDPKLRAADAFEIVDKPAGDWLREFFQGYAMLQRQRHLEEKQAAARQQRDGEKPPPYDENALKTLNDELRRLRARYIEHRAELYYLAETMPDSAYARAIGILRQHKDRNNRDFIWVWLQESCAETGGCCARGCGCCEKSLYRYIRPSEDGEKKGIADVYTHCTTECPCCIRHFGYYDPKDFLPKTILADEYERKPV